MVDDLTPSDPIAPSEAPAHKSGLAGFLATTTGKLVVGGIALFVVLAAVGAILVLFVLPGGEEDLAPLVPPAGSVSATSTPGGAPEAAPTLRRARPLSTTFVFRDIFVPTVKGTPVDTSTAGGGGTGTGQTPGSGESSVTVPADTLYLQTITTVDDVPTASLIWNGTTYQLAEGDEIPDTPWMVLDISGNSVIMLFGDSRVTLSVGQGIGK